MGINPLVVQQLESIEHQPFDAPGIDIATNQMKCSKSTALAKYRIGFLRQYRDKAVWKVLAFIFNKVAATYYS